MDFLDPRKKRAYKIRLYIGYFLMAVALSIGTLILLFEAYGYGVNKTGEVIQNGLVFVDSRPESARIILNGVFETDTDARLILPEDEYTIKLERNGYRPWQRTFEVEGSIVERLSYPFIFPEKLEARTTKQYQAQPAFATQSPDRRWLLVQQPGGLSGFDVIDLNDPENPTTTFTLPADLFTAGTGDHKLSLVEWSTDNRHVLLNHSFQAEGGSGFEFVMIDRENPTESFNVNRVFDNVPLAQVALRDKKFDQLYLLDNHNALKRGQVASRETVPIASHVRAFKGYGGDTILYVTEDGASAAKAFVNVRRGDDTYRLRELPRSPHYFVDLARYDGRWYMTVGSDTEQRALVYRNAFDDIARKEPRLPAPVAILRLDQSVQHLSFSANARFIGIQGGSEFSVYDAEHDRQYRYDTKLKLPAEYKAAWMDGYRYMVVSEDKVVVFDYDGINMQTLSASNAAFIPFFDRDYDFLYTLGQNNQGRSVLFQTSMRTPADE